MLPHLLCEYGAGSSLKLRLRKDDLSVTITSYVGVQRITRTEQRIRRVKVKCTDRPSEGILQVLRKGFTYCPSNKVWYSRKQKRVTVCLGMLVDKLVRCQFICIKHRLGTEY